MEELTIEQKAKAYDEAIEVARKYWNSPRTCIDIDVLPELFPEIKEIDDEEIRKGLIAIITDFDSLYLQENYSLSREEAIAWLEEQGEHANFRNKIQIGDKVTRNEDGVLVNLSQLKRVAKKDEKQGEQKPAEWSEDDENLLKLSLENLTELKDRFGEEYGKVGDCIVLLESIKERCTWKPSKEQISVLSRSLKYINTISPNYCHVLKELLAQLNKLREE